MLKSKMRLLGASALVGAGLLAVAPAEAYNIRLGDVDVSIDTTVSVGAQWRVEDRNLGFISEGQGSDHIDSTQGTDPLLYAGTVAALMGQGQTAAAAAAAAGQANLDGCGTANNKGTRALTFGNFCMYNASAVIDTATNGQSVAKRVRTADEVHSSRTTDAQRGKTQDFDAVPASQRLSEVYNYDRGINGDDGRLNFDNGDLTGGTFKATFDVEASMGMMRAFARVNAFYDAVLASEDSFERTELLSDADDILVSDIKLLDAYVDFDLDLLGQPLLIRAGKQVINWGESTFILGGNSAFNPIDVPAFRRPGAEVKEALIPVNALYASLALPYDLSVEAYVGGWDKFELDPAGGPFSTSDAFVRGSAGNVDKFYSGTGRRAGSNKRNCNAANEGGDATQAMGALMDTMFGTCDNASDPESYLDLHDVGHIEAGRQSYVMTVVDGQTNAGKTISDTDFMTRGTDVDGKDDENYGLAVRWYAENLNSTEFGLYYQKGYSRIPMVSGVARAPSFGPSTTGVGASSTLRGAGLSGCLSGLAGNTFTSFVREQGEGNSAVDGTLVTLPQGAIPNSLGVDQLDAVILEDPTGLGERYREELFEDATVRAAIIADAAANIVTALGDNAVALGANQAAQEAQASGALTAIVSNALNNMTDNSVAQAQELGCVANFANSTAGALIGTGEMAVAMRYRGELFAEYPEVETIGLSFATTVLGWGVQGEVAIRDEQPLQLDTDALFISTIAASCAWENFANVAELYYVLQTRSQKRCGDFGETIQGWTTEQSVTYDLGTTATFTRSNPVISALGADIGILLTEIGYQVVDNVEDDYRGGAGNTNGRLASKCTTGSDLPLGGVFGLDPRTVEDCRPTDETTGIVLFGQLQYNNVFGTPWGLQPTVVHREGISGMSPVAGGFIEGVKTTSLSLNASYQSNLSVNLGYVMYDGDELYNANLDRDTASLTVTYGF